MIKSLMTAVLGTRHERERKRLQPLVDRIHAEEEKLKSLSEAELMTVARATTVANCSISTWRRDGDLLLPDLFNSVAHLDGLA